MAFIIKPLVTEKVTKITEKTSAPKTLRARSKKAIETKNAVEQKLSYVVEHGYPVYSLLIYVTVAHPARNKSRIFGNSQ